MGEFSEEDVGIRIAAKPPTRQVGNMNAISTRCSFSLFVKFRRAINISCTEHRWNGRSVLGR